MRILNTRTMRTPIKVSQITFNYSQFVINIKALLVILMCVLTADFSFLLLFRLNSAGQGWGPSPSWNGSEPSLLPSLRLHDLPGLHPTQPLRCSPGWGHPTGRPAPPPAGKIYFSVSYGKVKDTLSTTLLTFNNILSMQHHAIQWHRYLWKKSIWWKPVRLPNQSSSDLLFKLGWLWISINLLRCVNLCYTFLSAPMHSHKVWLLYTQCTGAIPIVYADKTTASLHNVDKKRESQFTLWNSTTIQKIIKNTEPWIARRCRKYSVCSAAKFSFLILLL